MKALNFINKIVILFMIVIGGYTYTTYYGFLGLGDLELEKLLVVPMVIVPILIITFIINLVVKKKAKLTKSEVFFPLYATLCLLVPMIGGDALEYFMKIKVFEYCMFVGNVLSLVLIVSFIMLNIKRYKSLNIQ